MATQFLSTDLPSRVAKHSTSHPLAPVSAEEITQAVSYVKAQWPANTDLHFKSITLHEPAKAETVPYLEAEYTGQTLPKVDRRVFVTYYLRKTVRATVYVPINSTRAEATSRTSFTRL